MAFPVRITYRDVEHTEAIEAYVRRRASKLESSTWPVLHCHVVLDEPHRHKHHGRPFGVHITLAISGGEIVVEGARHGSPAEEDLYASIDAAFDRAVRRLHDYADRRRSPIADNGRMSPTRDR
jgi:ribosomal subunit interface protein